MDPAGIPALRDAIRHMHGCESRFVEWVRASDTFQGKTAWEREVGIFELVGHPTATRAYAWSEPGTSSPTARRFFAALHRPPVDGPLAAVRASILADARQEKGPGK
jgi:hypothetical protein